MTERVTPQGPETGSSQPRTGLAAVDAVLDRVDQLDASPLEEHPAAFERAHDELRAALDAPDDVRGPLEVPDQRPDQPPDQPV